MLKSVRDVVVAYRCFHQEPLHSLEQLRMHREVHVKMVELSLPQTGLDNRVADLGLTEPDLLRMYEKMGFRIVATNYIFHFHGGPPLSADGQGAESR